MKIWKGYGTEHSANLVIIGKFKTVSDADKAKALIEDLTRLVRDEEDKKITQDGLEHGAFSKAMLEFLRSRNYPSLDYGDLKGLLYDYDLEQEFDKIIVTSDDDNFMSIIKAIVYGEGKVEVYSAHNYPSQYGRQTYNKS
ncbi:hypothetical protein FACS189499_06030 [Clostridia bacterium]|nr:hypothetical protein FACS189499_06030 [Clostridia bacterium]